MSVQMYQSAKPLEALHPLQTYPQQILILNAYAKYQTAMCYY